MNEHQRRQSFRKQGLFVVAVAVLLYGVLNVVSGYLLKAALRSGARRLVEVVLLLPCYQRTAIVFDALDTPDPILELDATFAAKLIINGGLAVEDREKLRKKLEPKADSAILEETRTVARDAIKILDGSG
ncbi:MAG: hypothetical protein JWP89_3921 [Schlesneria sp.]|nr:hypothetical protein [Schlesneria sp.]